MTDILLIGPTLSADSDSIGGTTVSFELLLSRARELDYPVSVISVNRKKRTWYNALLVLYQAFTMVPRHRVIMLNANPRGALMLAPIISLYTRICGKRYVFRMFGGDLIEIYNERSVFSQFLIRKSIFSADRVYLQTRRMIEFFQPYSDHIKWLPTSRHIQPLPATGAFSKRFIYIGQIKQNKGVDYLIEIAETRPDISLSIYGPILESAYDGLRTKRWYHGVLPPDEVQQCLRQHDVLLLPTFHPGEGYPGIIIEAFAAGLPVISTRWLAIPEIVKHHYNGLLIATHSISELDHAISSITSENYSRLSANALASASQFDASTINSELLTELTQLARH
jgi:glycosyltransferase involved in cell wall biosynthesis